MKIAIFTDILLDVTGGIKSCILAQKNSLEAIGHEVHVFCPGKKWFSKDGEKPEKNVHIVPTCRSVSAVYPIARRPAVIEKWILKNFPDFDSFDIIHVHYECGASIAGIRLGKRFNIPVVQTMHGREDVALQANILRTLKTFVGFSLNRIHAMYLPHNSKVKKDEYLAPSLGRAQMWAMMVNHANQADLVLTPSKHFGQKLKHYGVKKPMEVLPNGIPDEMAPQRAVLRKFAEGETLKMIWNSRVSAEKRVMEFLETLKRLDGPYEVHMFGDGNMLEEAKKIASEHKLNIIFYGDMPRDKILQKMEECHLSVMTSYGFDTFGLTLVEAEVMGLPIFFCDPDMKEVVAEGGYLLSDNPNPPRMAIKINEIFRRPQIIEEMSRKLIEDRKNKFQSVKTKELIKIYERLIKNG